MAKAKTPQQLGHEFEADIQKHLLSFELKNRMRWHRFYDSRSAAGFLPEQPADHLVLWEGRAFLLEAKLSVEYTSLSSCLSSNLSSGQAAQLQLWRYAGATCAVIFKDYTGGHVEFWPGAYVGQTRVAPRQRLDAARRWARFPVEHLRENLQLLFEGGFNEPCTIRK